MNEIPANRRLYKQIFVEIRKLPKFLFRNPRANNRRFKQLKIHQTGITIRLREPPMARYARTEMLKL